MKDIESLLRSSTISSGPTWEQIGQFIGSFFGSVWSLHFLLMAPTTMDWTLLAGITHPMAQWLYMVGTWMAPLFLLLIPVMFLVVFTAGMLGYYTSRR